MAKLNYQKASRQRHLSKQPIVNSGPKVEISNPVLKRKVMRFGKYKHYEYRDLPDQYLKWAILNFEDDQLLNDLIIELQRRDPSFIISRKKGAMT
jgi:hypothetical protein